MINLMVGSENGSSAFVWKKEQPVIAKVREQQAEELEVCAA
jgi:hypothetical protein